MTDMQRIEREMLAELIGICQQLKLRYYLVCGSALGAVKYGGFIPWDDDIDIALPREDYTRLLAEAPGLLPEPLFLQTYRSDPAFPHSYSKLRHSGTTCIEENARHLPVHHGIALDIFPLDGYPQSKTAQWGLELGKKWYAHLLGSAFAEPEGLRCRMEYRLKRLLGLHRRSQRYAEKLEKLIARYPTDTAEVWCNHGNWQGKLEYMPRDWFGHGREAQFEGLKVVLPENTQAYLTQKYGDYRNDPPKEQQKSHHRYVVVDCRRPYTAYWPR